MRGAGRLGGGSGGLVSILDRGGSGVVVNADTGVSVHAARRARAQLAAARAAEITLSRWSGDESLRATHKNYNRFPCQRDE
jgi:hypothetical protein